MTYFASTRNDRSAYDGSASPCDSCSHKAFCGRHQLACGDLSHWLNAGRLARLNAETERDPSHSQYLRIFPGEGVAA